MKNAVYGLLTLVVACTVLSFTTDTETNRSVKNSAFASKSEAANKVYDIYSFAQSRFIYFVGFGSELNPLSYTPLSEASSKQPPSYDGTAFLYWIRITDRDHDYDVDNADFAVTVNEYNVTNPAGGQLSDESEIPGWLEKGGTIVLPPDAVQ